MTQYVRVLVVGGSIAHVVERETPFPATSVISVRQQDGTPVAAIEHELQLDAPEEGRLHASDFLRDLELDGAARPRFKAAAKQKAISGRRVVA